MHARVILKVKHPRFAMFVFQTDFGVAFQTDHSAAALSALPEVAKELAALRARYPEHEIRISARGC